MAGVNPYEMSREIRKRLPKSSRVMAPVRWYGGKGNMARWIVDRLPVGRIYVEPFCGAASVFWHLPEPWPVEVLNDIDGDVVDLFLVLQDPEKFEKLAHRITWTPYALDEFRRALSITHETAKDDVERAWAFFIRQNFGFSGKAKTVGLWSRVFVSRRGMAATASRWRSRMAFLDWWHERLTRVQIDHRDALEVIQYWDSPDTVFYVDPPYVHTTRKHKSVYKHECSNDYHEKLVDVLLGLKGQAAVSGYDHEIYKPLELAGWERHERVTACHAAGRVRGSKLRGEGSAKKHVKRVEVLWVLRKG